MNVLEVRLKCLEMAGKDIALAAKFAAFVIDGETVEEDPIEIYKFNERMIDWDPPCLENSEELEKKMPKLNSK